MSKKALYRHKRTGDLFAIETDEAGRVLSTSGPLLTKDLNSESLDYDNYWDPDIRANIDGFELLSQAEYRELLKRTGLFVQESQRLIFDETNHTKGGFVEPWQENICHWNVFCADMKCAWNDRNDH